MPLTAISMLHAFGEIILVFLLELKQMLQIFEHFQLQLHAS